MRRFILLVASLFSLLLGTHAQEARISVDAAQVVNRVSPLLYGSCIEDVNHEIYGGLYDQKIFGESFEEPPPSGEVVGYLSLGGNWKSDDENANQISVEAADGAKLLRVMDDLSDGSAEVQIKFPDRRGDNAGLLVRVQNAGIGADNFDGYEISLSAARQTVLLGKHRHDCEAAGFEPSFAINVEESAQDAADLVEYLNGPITSTWGRRRAQNGHPQPYNVRYIEIGNEEVIGADSAADYEHYIARFNALYSAMRAKDANLQFINAAWWRPDSPNMEKVFKALDGKASYWDLHPWADDPNAGREVDSLLTQIKTLFQKWNPNTSMKVAILEENGGLHNMQRALGHATILNAVRRHGDFVLTSCPANALQPLGQNDNGWDQGQIFFTSSQVWGMPPFYAQQMASRHHLPLLVKSNTEGALDVTATRGDDGKTLALHVVNTGATPIITGLQIQGFKPVARAQVEQLAAPLNAVNTLEKPEQVQTQRSVWQYNQAAPNYTFAPHSFTILRFE